MTEFKWKSFEIQGPRKFNLSRFEMQKRKYVSHYHDFAEVFWIEKGKCAHVVNGAKQIINEDSITFIRPKDTHKFVTFANNNPIFYNIAFTIDTFDYLYDRYSDCMRIYFPIGNSLPVSLTVDKSIIQFLLQSFKELSFCNNTRQNIERFLLNLFHELDFLVHENVHDEMPIWLSNALASFRSGEMLAEGTKGFVKNCYHSADHVNRVVKKHMGITLSELINKERLKYATMQLQTTSYEIIDIAYNCGYESLSYFYKKFKELYGVTPRQYRIETNGCLHEW